MSNKDGKKSTTNTNPPSDKNPKKQLEGESYIGDFPIVFLVSLVFCSVIAIWGAIRPHQMTSVALSATSFMLQNLDWFFLSMSTFLVALCLYLAFGKYAHIKLGGPDEKPEFSTISWLSMLFSAGMGCGLLFWGVAEPMFHFMSPPTIAAKTSEAARAAMVITNFHWGLHAWGIYAISALILAYFGFRKKKPYLCSTPIKEAFSGKYVEHVCHTTDVIAVLSVVFGVAGSLAMGVLQLSSGLNTSFHIATDSTFFYLGILVFITICFMISASTSLDKGIKILSNLNMSVAGFVLLFVIFAGPARFILEIFVNTLGDYATNIVRMSFHLYPYEGLQDWSSSWTLTYLIWWIAWGPFVGIFIARISKGRTIRQFIIGVLFLPTLFSILWFSAFGGAGFFIEIFGSGGLGELVQEDVTKALFALFDYYPLTLTLKILALFSIFVFLVTSADSATFVIGMMTSHGNLNPSTKHKLTWGLVIAVLSASSLLVGGIEVSKAIAISGAIPFSMILLLQIVAFFRILRTEKESS
ncbi:BCCT family transporter [Candidatus Uabimicrobium sp. HlEnr_7]|uniref:BCCT family transporter n=1 Tax=Candidatus Uabimicrobium helgolandensis TaxID=3095367 RepID=UPI00355605F4